MSAHKNRTKTFVIDISKDLIEAGIAYPQDEVFEVELVVKYPKEGPLNNLMFKRLKLDFSAIEQQAEGN